MLKIKWPVIAVLLYALLLLVVLMPLIFYFALWLNQPVIARDIIDEHLPLYLFGLLAAVMLLSELLLLVIPAEKVKEKPRFQRGTWVTATGAAMLFAILIAGTVWSAGAAIFADKITSTFLFAAFIVFIFINWLVWLVIFHRFSRNMDTELYYNRFLKILFYGSILELLIAVPSHIVLRYRETFCADMYTAAGIATGFAVMLLSFGPGIFYLYIERIKSRHAKPKE